MENAGHAATAAVEGVRGAREADRRQLRQQIQKEGGALAWMMRRAPLLGARCPTTWSEDQVAAETLAFYSYGEARLGRCGRCPPEGGECAGEDSNFASGQEPFWDEEQARFGERRCDKWREYVMRCSVIAAGVPPSSASKRFGEYKGELVTEIGTRFVDVIERRTSRPWLVLSGPHSSGKTHLSAALVRNVKRKDSSRAVVYVNVLQLHPALKQYWVAPSEHSDPLAPLTAADLAVVENLDPQRLNEPIRHALSMALWQRWESSAPTLITTHESLSRIAGAFSDLTDLKDAPECKLSR